MIFSSGIFSYRLKLTVNERLSPFHHKICSISSMFWSFIWTIYGRHVYNVKDTD